MQVVLEEFGKWIKAGTSATLAERDTFYQAVYQEVQNVRQLSLHYSPIAMPRPRLHAFRKHAV